MILGLLEMAEEFVSYEHADHWWYKRNPLSKLALLTSVLGFGIFAAAPTISGIYGVMMLAAVCLGGQLGGIPINKELRKRKGFVTAIVLMYGIVNLFTMRGTQYGRVLLRIPPWLVVTEHSYNFAIAKTSFLISSLVAVIIILKSTRMSDLTQALTKMKLPYAFSMIIATSIRCVPMVTDGLRVSYNAQRARGLELDKGGFRDRIRQIGFLLLPLMMMLLKTVDQMAIIFQSRGLDFSSRRRTYLRELPFSLEDWTLTSLGLGGLVTLVILVAMGVVKWQLRG